MKQELWMERVNETIYNWEKVQGVIVPQNIKDTVTKFMDLKIKKGIKKGTLARMFMQIAVAALIYIKMKRIK